MSLPLTSRVSTFNTYLHYGIVELREASHLERLTIALFCIACFHCAFLLPDITLIPGERTKLFTATICMVALVSALPFWKSKHVGSLLIPTSLAGIIGALLLTGALRNLPDTSPLYRSLGSMTGAMAGFFCARIHLRTPARQALFVVFAAVLLAGVTLITGVSLLLRSPNTPVYKAVLLHSNPHDIAQVLILLAFAPITLAFLGNAEERILAAVQLLLCYMVALLTEIRTAVFAVPLVGGIVSLICHRMRLRHFALLLVAVTLATGLFFYALPGKRPEPTDISVWFRLENYPFSLHISRQEPLTGIGLRASRLKHLKGYSPHCTDLLLPCLSDNQSQNLRELEDNPNAYKRLLRTYALRRLHRWVERTVTSENLYLTAIADTGWVVTVLFFGAVLILLIRLIAKLTAISSTPIPPTALAVSVCCALVHYLVYDGLLHVQMAFLFCGLLGIISHNSLVAWGRIRDEDERDEEQGIST